MQGASTLRPANFQLPRPGNTKADTKLPTEFKHKMNLNGLQGSHWGPPVPGTFPPSKSGLIIVDTQDHSPVSAHMVDRLWALRE